MPRGRHDAGFEPPVDTAKQFAGRRAGLGRILEPRVAEVGHPGLAQAPRDAPRDEVRGGRRAGRIDEVDRVGAGDAQPGRNRPRQPADEAIGQRSQGQVAAAQTQVPGAVEIRRSHHAHVRRDVGERRFVDRLVGRSGDAEHRHSPAVLGQVAGVFEGAQDAAAARVRRVLEGDEEGVPHRPGRSK